jgi:uncharacterized membrane protein
MGAGEQWTGDERRSGDERRTRFEEWVFGERREEERRRGGIGTHAPDPTERLLRDLDLPSSVDFEPAAGTRGDAHPEEIATPTADAGVSHVPFPSERAAIARTLAPDHEPHDAIPSTAAIAGHPLHPSVVPLPIGALAGALASDVAYVVTKDPFFARAARLLTLAGLVTGTLAAVLGGVDFWTRGQIRSHRAAWLHVIGNAATLLLGGISLGLRTRDERLAAKGPGLVLSAISGLVLIVTGWLGGELSYRHRVGITERESDR